VQEALRADGATAVLVTHDQGEALSMADQVAVMRSGRIIQHGTPTAVYREPATPWVARFVGEAVLLPATVDGAVAATPLGRLPLRGPAPPGETVTVLIRPEQIDLIAGGVRAAGNGGATATVVRHDFHGHDSLIVLRLADGTPVSARILDSTAPLAAGDQVTVSVRGPAFPVD
jgi:iron(III) transport system ATP-binding protein